MIQEEWITRVSSGGTDRKRQIGIAVDSGGETAGDGESAFSPRVLGDIPVLNRQYHPSGETEETLFFVAETGSTDREDSSSGDSDTASSDEGTDAFGGIEAYPTSESDGTEEEDTAGTTEGEEVDTAESPEEETAGESEKEKTDTSGESEKEDTADESEEGGENTTEKSEEDGEDSEDTDDENESGTLFPWQSENGPSIKLIAGGAIAAALILAVILLLVRRRIAARDTKTSRASSFGSGSTSSGSSASADRLADTADSASGGEIVWKSTIVTEKTRPNAEYAGKLHHIGKRSGQQDSLGIANTPAGVLAVVADGMGGLADGDKVSQKVVMTILQQSDSLTAVHSPDVLKKMVDGTNTAVNRMLGPDKLYKCGSTLLAVLAGNGSFEWVSVGDSRIYLYRNGRLIQLNREHVYEAELMQKVVRGELTFAEARSHPKRKGLTSFIGMGKLKYVDGSCRPIPTEKGDILLLMSDGVFNTLSEDEMCAVLQEYQNPAEAADVMKQKILLYNKRAQDNFTAIILPL